MKLLHRRTPAMPVTHVSLLLPRRGACLDPTDRRGLSRLLLRLHFCGAAGLGNSAFHERLERLGASAGAGLGNDHWSLRLSTLTANLEPALELFLSALTAPNLEPAELERLRGELSSSWRADREEHKQIRAQEVYLSASYRDGAQAYQSDGLDAGLRACTLEDMHAGRERLFGPATPILAVLSDLERDAAERLVAAPMTAALAPLIAAGAAREESPYPWDGFEPPQSEGIQVSLVHEADTNTDEVLLGGFSTHVATADWHLHRIISYTFGGDMTSRLFREVRGERGYSYGASCWYEAASGRLPRNQPAPFSIYTFPSAEHSAEAVPLVLRLYSELVERGITEQELTSARSALTNAYPFKRDTPQKLLALDVDHALYGISADDEATNRAKLASATLDDVQAALREHHDPSRLRIVLLGDTARLQPVAESLPNVAQVETLRYP